MKIIGLLIFVNGLFGLIVAALYYPSSPVYLFQSAHPEEIWLWSKYVASLSAVLVVLALLTLDTNNAGRDLARSISAFVSTLQGILCLPPVALYIVFLRGANSAAITVRGQSFTVTYAELFLLVMLAIVSWSSAAYLALISGYEKGKQAKGEVELAA